jgi:hypothetical protein
MSFLKKHRRTVVLCAIFGFLFFLTGQAASFFGSHVTPSVL